MENDYTSMDIYLTSTLLVLGYKFTGWEKDSLGKVTFKIKNDSSIKQTIEDYWEGKLELNPLNLWKEFKFLKSVIYDTR